MQTNCRFYVRTRQMTVRSCIPGHLHGHRGILAGSDTVALSLDPRIETKDGGRGLSMVAGAMAKSVSAAVEVGSGLVVRAAESFLRAQRNLSQSHFAFSKYAG